MQNNIYSTTTTTTITPSLDINITVFLIYHSVKFSILNLLEGLVFA